jgi:hypothetical protein
VRCLVALPIPVGIYLVRARSQAGPVDLEATSSMFVESMLRTGIRLKDVFASPSMRVLPPPKRLPSDVSGSMSQCRAVSTASPADSRSLLAAGSE